MRLGLQFSRRLRAFSIAGLSAASTNIAACTIKIGDGNDTMPQSTDTAADGSTGASTSSTSSSNGAQSSSHGDDDSHDSSTGNPPGDLAAFPGAAGFGALASGGRGGSVCYVTTNTQDGEGSLQSCIDREQATIVLFKVSGVIEGPVTLRRPNLTIAGQSSPGGVIVRGGLICDNIYDEQSQCENLVIRHLRVRQGEGDSVRLGGTNRVIFDHLSLGNATDELLEISRSFDITVQNSLFAEPIGDHYQFGGLLLNYSTTAHPLSRISLHHNLWNGVFGRLPEISCEENNDAPGTNCSGHLIELALVSNLYFDTAMPIWYNRCTGTNEGNDCPIGPQNTLLAVNWIENRMIRRASTDPLPMIEGNVGLAPGSTVFAQGNVLVNGNTEMAVDAPVTSAATPLDFPAIESTPNANLSAYMQANVGAFPRDTMDQRLLGYLAAGIAARPAAWTDSIGIDMGDALVALPGGDAPIDSDGDGMPDTWEQDHGLDPQLAHQGSTILSSSGGGKVVGCTVGYTDVECYLNELAALRVGGFRHLR